MSITDELRGFVNINTMSGRGYKELCSIADRIDAEYQKAEDEWEVKGGQSWLNGYEECRVELMEGNEVVAASLEEAGWIRLPKDADGMLIHIWDRMEHIELGYVCEVIAVGVGCFIAWNTHANRYCQYDSTLFRHHHEPTVEDVLREFALDIDPSADVDISGKPIIERFAAKLQLKEHE